MARKCKCKICGKQLTTDTAFKVTNDKKNTYYCSKEEYDLSIQITKERDECFNYIAECMRLKFCTPFIKKEINYLLPYYDYPIIKRAFKDNIKSIDWFLDNNENNSEFGKVRYIFTIIQNNINKSAKDYKEEQEKMRLLFKKENDIDIELINKLDNKNNKINNIHDISNFLD